jgi:hypothetical protein
MTERPDAFGESAPRRVLDPANVPRAMDTRPQILYAATAAGPNMLATMLAPRELSPRHSLPCPSFHVHRPATSPSTSSSRCRLVPGRYTCADAVRGFRSTWGRGRATRATEGPQTPAEGASIPRLQWVAHCWVECSMTWASLYAVDGRLDGTVQRTSVGIVSAVAAIIVPWLDCSRRRIISPVTRWLLCGACLAPEDRRAVRHAVSLSPHPRGQLA